MTYLCHIQNLDSVMTVFSPFCIFDLAFSRGSINSGHRFKKKKTVVLVTKFLFFHTLPYSYEAYALFSHFIFC